MGNSESFDLITISDQNQKHNKTIKKKPTHHHHSQTISNSLKTITSFDLNGIFRKINEESNDYHPEKKNKMQTTAPPPPSSPETKVNDITTANETGKNLETKREEKSEEVAYSQSSSESSEPEYIEQKLQEVENMNVPETKFLSVTLTKSTDNLQNTSDVVKPDDINEESIKNDESEKSDETVKSDESNKKEESEKTEVVIDENKNEEDMINLDNEEVELEQQQKQLELCVESVDENKSATGDNETQVKIVRSEDEN